VKRKPIFSAAGERFCINRWIARSAGLGGRRSGERPASLASWWWSPRRSRQPRRI